MIQELILHILAKLSADFLWALIRVYQFVLSPLLPGHCRYYPTCSQYALEAVQQYGTITGVWLAIRRIVRCQPWGSSGFDPVPPRQRAEPGNTGHIHGKCIAPRQTQRYIRAENLNNGHSK